MISTICFSLSALCLAAMISLKKTARSRKAIPTHYVGDPDPLPTWRRKAAPTARVSDRVG